MKTVMKIIKNLEEYVSVFFLCVMCIAVTFQIIFRVILKSPLLFTEEIARYSYVWCVFFCIAMGEKHNEHFAVDIFVRFLKQRASDWLYAIEKLIGCICFALLFVWSVQFLNFEWVVKSSALGISMGLVALSMCFGFGLSFIRRGYYVYYYVRKALGKDESAVKEV